MAVDRGELRYRVSTQYRRTGLRRFREDVIRARASFRDFRRDVERPVALSEGLRDTARDLREVSRQQRRVANSTQEFTREQLAQQRALAAAARAQAQREREAVRIRRQQTRDAAARRRQLEQEAAAQARLAREELRRERGVRRTTRALRDQEGTANRLLFTFRRLVGVLAAFTLAREAVNGFRNLLALSIRFNSSVEQSQLGIAGIITAVGEVRDEQGRLLQGAEAFAAAQGEARRQQQLLRTDALRTTATFEELIDVFQIATGPGLAEGLGLDQIRQLSVGISQAASAIGLEQRQLSEEIRALLTGNIRATTTRIAQVLNLSNEDIRAAQEQGQLFELLNERLSGFALAAEGAARTVPGLLARINDAIGLTAGRAGIELFEELRVSLQGIFDLLTQVETVDGVTLLQPNPQVVTFFDAIFDAIAGIVENARELASSTGFGPFLSTARALGSALQIVGSLITAIAIGAVRGFGTIAALVDPILTVVTALTSGSSDAAEGFQEVVALIAQIATILLTVRVATIAWGAAVTAVKAGFAFITTLTRINALLRTAGGLTATWATVMRLVRLNAIGTVAAIIALPLALAAIVNLVFRWASEAEGVKINFEQVLRIIGLGMRVAFETAAAAGRAAFAGVEAVAKGFAATVLDITLGILERAQIVAAAIPGLGDIAEDITTAQLALERTRDNLVREGIDALDEFNEELERTTSAFDTFFEGLNEVNQGTDRTLGELLGDVAGDAARQIGDFFGQVDAGFADATEEANAFAEALSVTGRVEAVTTEDRDAVRRAQQRAETTRQELEAQRALLEVQRQGGVQSQISLVNAQNKLAAIELEAQQQLQNLEIEREKVELASGEFEARRDLLDSALELAETDEERTAILEENKNLVDQLALAEASIAAIEEQIANARSQQAVDLEAARIAVERAREVAEGQIGVQQQRVAQAIAERDAVLQTLAAEQALLQARLADPDISEDERIATETAILDLKRQQNAENFLATEEIFRQKLALEETLARAEGSFTGGLAVGLQQFALDFGNAFDNGLALARQSLQSFASFAADSIVAAFDPTDDTSIKERFARFLQGLARQILTQITTLLIATAIAKAFGVPLPGDSTPPPALPSFAEGGHVDHKGPRVTPPPGVPRSDTRPAYLTPGEFVHTTGAVRAYGLDVMEAINQRLIDPLALKALAGARKGASLRRSATKGPGFQQGGLVSDQLTSFGSTLEDIRDKTGQEESTAPAVALPANDRTMESLLSGGKGAFRRFLRENAQDFDGILRGGRSGSGA